VGATPPVKADVFALIASERSIGGSPTGSPITIRMMLEFCNCHKISPLVEKFPLSSGNEAMDHLKAGKARDRIVLEMISTGQRELHAILLAYA
jgi:alcohol/geraniol dehydrogenase (NADP+)